MEMEKSHFGLVQVLIYFLAYKYRISGNNNSSFKKLWSIFTEKLFLRFIWESGVFCD